MSGDTLVYGSFAFKNNVTTERQAKIVAEANGVFEDEFEYRNGDYHISSINWSSYVTKEKVDKFFKKFGKFFIEYGIDLYYLTEPDERWIKA
jgi:hypothetical protein